MILATRLRATTKKGFTLMPQTVRGIHPLGDCEILHPARWGHFGLRDERSLLVM